MSFSATQQALEGRRGAKLSAGLAGILLLGAWTAFVTLGRVTVYAVTDRARIEVAEEPRRIEAPPHDGRVSAVHASLGQRVRAGDLLLELEVDAEQALHEGEVARRRAAATETAALGRQIAALQSALASSGAAAAAELAEVGEQEREADAALRLARSELDRKERLAASGHVSESEIETARTVLEERQAARSTLSRRRERIARDAESARDDRQAEIQRLRGRLAHLEGEVEIADATIAWYEHELAHHQVRSPVDGRIGELAELEEGTFLRAGQPLGTIIPDGALRVVAQYLPRDAGRLRPGQSGRLHLVAYPSTAHGFLRVEVERAAAEPRGGTLRVELRILPESIAEPPGALEHGLAGRLDLAVQRVAPWRLLMRELGEPWQEPAAPDSAAEPPAVGSRPPAAPPARAATHADDGTAESRR